MLCFYIRGRASMFKKSWYINMFNFPVQKSDSCSGKKCKWEGENHGEKRPQNKAGWRDQEVPQLLGREALNSNSGHHKLPYSHEKPIHWGKTHFASFWLIIKLNFRPLETEVLSKLIVIILGTWSVSQWTERRDCLHGFKDWGAPKFEPWSGWVNSRTSPCIWLSRR